MGSIPWKRYLLFATLLGGMVWSIGGLLEYLALKFDPSEPKVVEMLAMEGQSYDLLYAGNSVAMQGFYPPTVDSTMGTHSYNLALGGATLIETEITLHHYLSKNEKPKRLICGLFVNEKSWENDLRPTILWGVQPEIRQYYHNWLGVDPWFAEDDKAFFNRFRWFQHRLAIEHALKYLVDGENRKYVYEKGFLNSSVQNPIPTYLPDRYSGINTEGLSSLHTYCQSLGIEVLYVELPNHAIFNETTEYRAQTIRDIEDIVGDRFFSLNQPTVLAQFSSEDWTGLNHLSKSGAIKCSAILADSLVHRSW